MYKVRIVMHTKTLRKIRNTNGTRLRFNITMAQDVHRKAEELRLADLRGFSNFLELLVNREWDRRRPEQAPKA